MTDILERAVREAGGVVALSKALGITHNAIYSWKRIPPGRVLDIERVTGISRHDLRPDIFGPSPEKEQA